MNEEKNLAKAAYEMEIAKSIYKIKLEAYNKALREYNAKKKEDKENEKV